MASILVIDDDEAVRELLRLGLEGAGYTVREAKHGRDGTREFRKAPIDLVITDLYMPFCDGLDVIRRLRRVHHHLPILAMSGGSGTMDYLRLAKTDGASGVIYKPFTIDVILKAIADLLGKGEGAA